MTIPPTPRVKFLTRTQSVQSFGFCAASEVGSTNKVITKHMRNGETVRRRALRTQSVHSYGFCIANEVGYTDEALTTLMMSGETVCLRALPAFS